MGAFAFSSTALPCPLSSRGFRNSSPSYLVLHRHVLYFRITVPADLRPMLGGKRELRKSLNTHSLKIARAKAIAYAAMLTDYFHRLREEGSEGGLEELSHTLEELFPRNNSPALPPRRQSCQHVDETSPSTPPQEAYKRPTRNRRVAGLTLKEALGKFIAEKSSTGEWRSQTVNSERGKFTLFGAIVGEGRAVQSLTRADLSRYKEELRKLPRNWSRSKLYASRPLDDILAKDDIPPQDRMGPETVNNHFTQVKVFIHWAANNGHLPDGGIASCLVVKASKQAHEYREAFTPEELRKLFAPATYPSQTEGWKYWVPLLGLYTGARLEEICQLHVRDVVKEDGLWCLFIRDDAPDQQLKNPASRRSIPLHRSLIEEKGFIKFVEEQQVKRVERLFPDLKRHPSRNKYSHYPSRWFGMFRRSVLGEEASHKDFHCFRHTTAKWCLENGVRQEVAARFLGHQVEDMTYGRYGGVLPVRVLFEELVSRFRF